MGRLSVLVSGAGGDFQFIRNREGAGPCSGQFAPSDLLLSCRTKMKLRGFVIPAKAGIQERGDVNSAKLLDSHFRGNDKEVKVSNLLVTDD